MCSKSKCCNFPVVVYTVDKRKILLKLEVRLFQIKLKIADCIS
jgi:hypothetical protein